MGGGASGTTRPRGGLLLGLPMLVALHVLMVLAALCGKGGAPRISGAAIFTMLVSAALFGHYAVTRRKHERASRAAVGYVLAWAPSVGFACMQALETPLAWGDLPSFAMGVTTRSTASEVAGLLFRFPIGLLFIVGIGTVAALLLLDRGSDRIVRVAAAAIAVASLGATAVGLSRIGRPDPDTYLSTLVPSGSLRPGEERDVLGTKLHYVTEPIPPTVFPGEPVVPDATPKEWSCRVVGLEAPIHVATVGLGRTVCPDVQVRLAPDGGLATLTVAEQEKLGWLPLAALRPGVRWRATVTPRDLGSSVVAPPIGWTFGAAFGVVASALTLLLARRHRRAAASLDGEVAQHLGAGNVQLASGEVMSVQAAALLPQGPITLGPRKHRILSYRESALPNFETAVAGTLKQQQRSLRDRAASLEAIALGIVVLAATPLLVARLAGLL